MRKETREARQLQKALLSHVHKSRWIIRRLRTLMSKPPILQVRISDDETTFVMGRDRDAPCPA